MDFQAVGTFTLMILLLTRDRNFLFIRQGIANHEKIIKSIKYDPSQAQPQHVVAVPGWGFDVRRAVEIKTTPERVHYKIGPNPLKKG